MLCRGQHLLQAAMAFSACFTRGAPLHLALQQGAGCFKKDLFLAGLHRLVWTAAVDIKHEDADVCPTLKVSGQTL